MSGAFATPQTPWPFDLTPGVITVFDLETNRCDFINRSVGGLLGFSPDEVRAMGNQVVPMLMHPEDRPGFERHLIRLRSLGDGESAGFEHRMRDRTGQWHWFSSRDAVLDRDEAGGVRRIIGTSVDISAHKAKEEAQARLAAIVESSTDAICSSDLDGRILTWNQSAERLFGYAAPEVVGRHFRALFPSERSHEFSDIITDIQNGQSVVNCETEFRKKDGGYFDGHLTASPVKDADGRIFGLSVIARDITALKRDSEALRRSEQLNRITFELAPVGMANLGLDGRFIDANESMCQITGYSVDELKRMKAEDVTHPEDRARTVEAVKACLSGGLAVYRVEKRYVRKDGGVRWVEVTARMVNDAGGRPLHSVGIILDITERKQAEQARETAETALRSSNDRFELAIRGTADGIWDWNTITNEGFSSDRYNELLGYQPGELLSRYDDWVARIHPEDRERVTQHVRAHLENRALCDIEYRLRTKDGEFRWFRARGHAVWDEDGKPLRMAGSISDITERRNLQQRLEQALQRSGQTLRAVVDAAPLAVVSVDRGGRVTGWNPAASRIFGYPEEEAMGQAFPIGHAELLRELLASVAAGRTVVAQECSCSRKDGSILHASVSIAPLTDGRTENCGAIALIQDVTERRQAEEDLRTITAALATAREDEVRRIACDLHDDIGQKLAMLAVDIGKAAAEPPSPGGTTEAQRPVAAPNLSGTPPHTLPRPSPFCASSSEVLRSFQAKILQLAGDIRRISHRMHPSILDDLGLCDALESLCREFEAQEGIPVDFRMNRLPGGLRPEVKSCLYRIAQECLRNISKYARHSDVTLTLAAEGDAIELSIVDSGAGFNQEERKPGLGLHSMKERVRLVNGALTIATRPGAGTQVVVRVPLQAGRP